MAFHPDYANIDMRNRDSRPDVLYKWEPPPCAAAGPKPGYMIDEADGRYLIDIGGHPIRNWYELPVCISGQTSAVWMEYWRRINPSITLADIVARCPKKTQKHSQTRVQELTLQAFGNRMRRTRVMLGTNAWEAREGTREVKARLKDLMPNRVRAELARNGTTKSWRDLITAEIDAIFHVNKGKGNAIARAGDKRLSEAERRARDGKKQAEVAATLQRLQDEKRADDAIYDSMRPATEGSDIPDAEVRDQMHENRDSEALVRSRANQSEECLGTLNGRNADSSFTNLPQDERSTRATAGEGNTESTSDDSLLEEDTTVVEQQADYVALYEQQFRIHMGVNQEDQRTVAHHSGDGERQASEGQDGNVVEESFTDMLGDSSFQVPAVDEDVEESPDSLFEDGSFTLIEPAEGDATQQPTCGTTEMSKQADDGIAPPSDSAVLSGSLQYPTASPNEDWDTWVDRQCEGARSSGQAGTSNEVDGVPHYPGLVENVPDQQQPEQGNESFAEQVNTVGQLPNSGNVDDDIFNNDFEIPEIDPADYRHRVPQTAEESNQIAAALERTYEECRLLTGWEPPLSDPQASYADCFYAIIAWLSTSYEAFRPDENEPIIFMREAWTDAWDGWMAQDVQGTNFSFEDWLSQAPDGADDAEDHAL
ncbi:MAG: hypothetical protein Q9197_003966 [Variospora fuerteventurae]